MFSWKGFIVCTRLSYTFYLTQFPVFFYNVGSHRSALEYSFGMIVSTPPIYIYIHVYLRTFFRRLFAKCIIKLISAYYNITYIKKPFPYLYIFVFTEKIIKLKLIVNTIHNMYFIPSWDTIDVDDWND